MSVNIVESWKLIRNYGVFSFFFNYRQGYSCGFALMLVDDGDGGGGSDGVDHDVGDDGDNNSV